MGSKKPPPPPDMTPVINMYRELGMEQNALAREQMQMQRDRQAALQPLETKMLQGQIDAQGFALGQARDSYDFYKSQYRPAEEAMISQAMNYNSEAEKERMASQAGADTEQALATQRGSSMRQLERMGVNPNSGRFMQLMSSSGLGAAKMRAGAENNARVQANEIGYQRLAGVSALGRGLAGQSLNAVQAGSGAASAGGGLMGASDRASDIYTNNAQNFYQGQGAAIGGMGNTMGTDYQNRLGAHNARQSSLGGIGQLVGMGASMFMSSKDMKTDNASINEEAVLAKVKALPVEGWRYNDSPQRHVGPYAEDVQRQFGNDVAPGGQMIDAVSMHGINLAATKALARKVDELERRMDPIPNRMATGGLVRGPGTGTSDEVPAVNTDNGDPIRLSNGEYVLPAETVRQIGLSKLDNIVMKTNGKPPVHRQKPRNRALKRK